RFVEFMNAEDLDTSFRDLDPEVFGLPDEEITNVIDVSEWVAVKERSLQHHRTQMDPNGPFAKMPQDQITAFRSKEYFVLAAGVPLPNTPEARGDLFAGLR